jgi:hypothetical protein
LATDRRDLSPLPQGGLSQLSKVLAAYKVLTETIEAAHVSKADAALADRNN